MADKNSAPPFVIQSKPGIQRDGTSFDSDNYQSGEWVRFQRGRPQKIGGYRAMATYANGPIRDMLVDSRTLSNTATLFSTHGVERLRFDAAGSGGGLTDRTPTGFVANDNYTWTTDTMFDTQGTTAPLIIAAATPDLMDIASDEAGPIYYGDVTAGTPLVQALNGTAPVMVSGGIVVLQPFLFYYGSNGLIGNADTNSMATTAFAPGGSSLANIVNVAGTKIVYGLPARGGDAAPAGLFWALDALIKVTFIGSTALFKYDTVAKGTSVLSKKSIIDYDGVYYWTGIDRFYVYDGTVHEVPNNDNLNWFYKNLNFAQRQKVWAMKVPRFGEIWWFYPRGDATECTHAIVLNLRDNCWFDVALGRSAGAPASVFQSPIMAGVEDSEQVMHLPVQMVTGQFRIGERLTGVVSSGSGIVSKVGSESVYLTSPSGIFSAGEPVSSLDTSATAVVTAPPKTTQLDVVWQHEVGRDKVTGQSVTAIRSSFTTHDMSYAIGGPTGAQSPLAVNMDAVRVEPDFVQEGDMTMYVGGGSYARSSDALSQAYEFSKNTEFIDVREQRRRMHFTFVSNTVGGYYEMGKTLATVVPGDARP